MACLYFLVKQPDSNKYFPKESSLMMQDTKNIIWNLCLSRWCSIFLNHI